MFKQRANFHKYVTIRRYNSEKGVGVVATEYDIIRDEQERGNLLRAIADVETAIAVSTPGTRRVLENTLDNARKRITTLDKRIDEAKVEHAAEVQAQVTAAGALAAKETKLNAEERETYRGFLSESFFTKKDFGKLDEFYTHSYDRLSEGGKDEMSKRLHEGIKRGEFKFSDLSKAVQERDSAHCSAKPAKENPAQAPVLQHKVSSGSPTPPVKSEAVSEIDLKSVDLSGVKLADVSGSQSASSLPDGSASKASQRGA